MVVVIKSSKSFALRRVQKAFPKVITVSDETSKRVTVTVKETDTKNAQPGEFTHCALAKAACRELKLDGAIIGLTYSYLIKGTHATRYSTPDTVAREMVSFDRHSDFDSGTYHLAPVTKMNRLGEQAKRKRDGSMPQRKHGPLTKHNVHRTARVRHHSDL